ncbi:probable pectin methylesterase CGR3 [Salvia hispanica]|uniref:probable pectin methylesterase CGR3 n=1 Tax=Salvia hispanica TaxID=49212 RepID=UPI002009B571|nr:probable pectin methylesterase CGR3 [Salvia hispanica]
MKVWRRPVNPARRPSESEAASFASHLHSRSRPPPYLSIALLILGAILVIGYLRAGQDALGSRLALSWAQGDVSCSEEVQRAVPILKAAYGNSMQKVLHVGPDACSTVSRLLREEETDAWGVEPYDTEDADRKCKRMVKSGLVRVADIKFLLPYRAKSFPLVIVSDALDYLSPKYLNRTIPELARVSSSGLIIFTGYPRNVKAKANRYGNSVKLRSANWWGDYFDHLSLEENEDVAKKFEKAAEKMSHIPHCQIFHLKPYN